MAEIIHVESPRAFFRKQADHLDAVVYSAEAGAAWTLIYPDFSVVVPGNAPVQLPMAYPLPRGDLEWTRFVSAWVDMNVKNRRVELLFNHWIGGGGAKPKEPRWSVIRDVLGWID